MSPGQESPKAATAVVAGAVLEVSPPVVPNLDLVAEDVPLDILYEDEETLVLNKQAGIIVHPRPGMNAVTLINAVRVRYPEGSPSSATRCAPASSTAWTATRPAC